MMVNAYKFGHATLRRPQVTSDKYTKSAFYWHLKSTSYLRGRIEVDADFTIADRSKGSFVVVGTKKGKTFHLQTAFIAPELSIEKRLERLEEQYDKLVKSTWSYLFSKKDIKEMGELSKGMLEGSKKMRELAEQLEKAEDED
jgi:hypothetical protein